MSDTATAYPIVSRAAKDSGTQAPGLAPFFAMSMAAMLATSVAADCADDCNAVFSGQASPIAPATSNGVAVVQFMVPDRTDSSVGASTIIPCPVVTCPNQDINDLFKRCSP